MAYAQAYDDLRERGERVLQALAAHRLAASPENYRLWYVHLAGEDPALSRALSTLIEQEGSIDETRCAELNERFLVRAAGERTLLQAGQRLNDLAGALAAEVAGFGGETARYGTSLQDARARVDAGPTAERLASIVRSMLDESGRMQAHVDQVETRLQASMTEIDGLRQRSADRVERGAHRRPDWAREPPAFRPGVAHGCRASDRARHARLRPARGYRPLQAIQRHPRPRLRRPGPEARGRAAAPQRQGPVIWWRAMGARNSP